MRTDDRTEEQILVMRAQRGDQAAFRILVERYQSRTYTLALRMLNRPADAEDASQEAFLAAWKALPKFRMDASFSTWLYRLTVNAATDLLRKRKKTQGDCSLDDEQVPVHAADQSAGPEEQMQRTERQEVLQKAIASLSENHRKILLLREIGGLDYREIGEALELTPGTVKSRLARARQELREKLLAEGNYFETSPSNKRKGGEGDDKL